MAKFHVVILRGGNGKFGVGGYAVAERTDPTEIVAAELLGTTVQPPPLADPGPLTFSEAYRRAARLNKENECNPLQSPKLSTSPKPSTKKPRDGS
jgi:hypothetical protein